MKAAQYASYGGPEVLTINSVAPKPELKDGQVLVEVHASSVNPFDDKVRMGYMKEMIPLQFPVTIGDDFSGVVSEVFDGVTQFAVGDEVYGQVAPVGATAEFVAVGVEHIGRKPKGVDFTETAALVLVGVSSIQALEDHIHLSAKQKILIHGGTGGIGSIAIQLAKHLGAHVATTVSTDSVGMARLLGADEVIDYKTQKFEDIVKNYDAVFDTVGGDNVMRSYGVLKQGGVLVTMTGSADENVAKEYGVTAINQSTGTTTERLDRLTAYVEEGVIKPQVAKTFSLDETRHAYEYFETSHPKGKVVITIKE